MSFCLDGLDLKLKNQVVKTQVPADDTLIKLANQIEWTELAELASADLQRTVKGCWWLGRKINLRTHFSILILQSLLKETDRGMEQQLQRTPIFQVFCGFGSVTNWHCPDHTKIEEFRNRLSPDTHKKIGDIILKTAHSLGFAKPSWMDLDSTVQDAGVAYPSDANLMRKLAKKCMKILEFMKLKKKKYLPVSIHIDIAAIEKQAKAYFFLAKNTAMEKKRAIFADFHSLVKKELKPMIQFCQTLNPQASTALPWNIKDSLNQVRNLGWRYLLDVAHFVRTNTVKPGKILAFHRSQMSCIRKGKIGKENEFGRVFQLGRIGGNFLVPFTCHNIKMNDKTSLPLAVMEHQQIFGQDTLQEIGTDKGYYSKNNIQVLEKMEINSDGVQRPYNVKIQPDEDVARPLRHRRAGVESLIRHAKDYGLRKSKMRSDRTTLSSGYRSVMGFNLRQLERHLGGLMGGVAL